MKKFNLTALLLLVVLLVSAAEIPDTYYTPANGKSDSELKSSLHRIIKVGTRLGYGSGCSSTWGGFATSDVTPEGKVWDMYSYSRPSFSASCAAASGMNVEHSFAKSWWGGDKNNAYKDLYHLNPSLTKANSARGNRPPGVVVNSIKYDVDNFRVGRNPAYGDFDVFEPEDQYKGDFARAYFYMATCYEDLTWRLDNKDVGSYYAMQNTDYKEFQPWFCNVMLEWHRQDPVSQKEIDRLAAIYVHQSNRNPFIDYPCLVEYIWGNKQGQVVDFGRLMSSVNPNYLTNDDKSGCSCEISEPTITAPQKNSTVNVGAANLNETLTANINVQGVLLTQNSTLAISGANSSLFTVSTTTLTAEQVLNSVNVTVSYKPTTLGQHTATLTLSNSELAANIVVNLTGSCLATLTSPTTAGLSFSGNDASLTQQQLVTVKGTNLANNVTLALSGTHAAKFTLSKSSLTAAEVKAGETITVNYSPTSVNTHTAILTVSSSDFASVVVPITGECTFEALEETNVTLSGFTANWTNAAATDYVLDVYTKELTGGGLVEVVNEQFNGSMSANVSVSGFSILTELGSTAIRIGSSGTAATMTITGLNLSQGATLSLNAKLYSSSDASTLTLKVGTTTIATWNQTAAYSIFTAEIPPSAETSVTLTTGASKPRAYIDWLKISVGGEVITNTSVVGYPKSVGAVQAYNVVTPMSKDKPYYYTVKPTAINLSEEIEVLYEIPSGTVDLPKDLGIVCLNTENQIHILNLPEDSHVRIFDVMGRLCNQRANCNLDELFEVPTQGVYMIQIFHNGNFYTLKTSTF